MHNSFFCFGPWWDARRQQIQPPLVLKDELTSGRTLVIEWNGTDMQILIRSREAMQVQFLLWDMWEHQQPVRKFPLNLQGEEGPEAQPSIVL